jgi:PAS domain S-box-containing protein
VEGVALLLRDLTYTNKDKAELEKLSLAVQYSPNPVIITDADAVIEYVNPRFTDLTGYAFQEAVGKNPRILKSNRTPQSTYDELWNTLTKGEVWRGEFINKMKNGRVYRQKSAIASVKDPNGRISHYVAVIEDVTKQKETEAALVESEHRLKEILEKNSLVAVMMDMKGRLNYANDLFAKMLDLPKKLVIGKTFYEFVAPKQREELQRLVIKSITKDRTQSNFDCNIVNANNENRIFSLSAVPLHNTEREIVGVACVGEDITERKRAENEISESRRQVLDILESISDAFFALDNSWRFTYMNKNAEKLLGMTKLELLFRNLWESLPDFVAHKLCSGCEKAKAEMKVVSFEEYYPFLDKWFEGRIYPYENGISVYLSDITRRINIEKERNLYLNRLKLIIDSTSEGIYGMDNKGRCTLFNSAATKITGYSSEEVLGRDMHSLIHYKHADGSAYPAEDCPIVRASKEGGSVHNSDVFWRKDGSPFSVEYTCFPIHDDHALHGSVVTFTEIAHRKSDNS